MGKLLIKINKKQLLILQESYKTDRAIADYLGVTRQYIHILRKKYDVKLIPAKGNGEDRNKLIYSDFIQNMRICDLVKKFGLSRQAVYNILKKYKS